MKKITLLLMLMVASLSFGQLKKVDTSQMKNTTEEIGKFVFGGKLYFETTKKDSTYTFTYRDAEFTTIDVFKSFTMEETGSDFETLYTMIEEGLVNQPKEPVVLELKDYFLTLYFDKSMGAPRVRFASSDKRTDGKYSFSSPMLSKDVAKAFGKAKKKKKK